MTRLSMFGVDAILIGLFIWFFAHHDVKNHPDWDHRPTAIGIEILCVGIFLFVIGFFA